MKGVTWAAVAARDLQEAERYLAGFHPAIGRDLIVQAIEAAGWLLDHPGVGSPIGRTQWRKWRVRRSHYLLIYRQAATGIEIGRVRYDRSDWRRPE